MTYMRMTRGEAEATRVLVTEYHNFHDAFAKGEVRRAVTAARKVQVVKHIAKHINLSIADILRVAEGADRAGFY